MPTAILLILIGLLLITGGAEFLVRGASAIARRLKVSPLVIGLTIVAYGTSMPELAVSVRTALTHQGAISAGNVIGSNIFNIGFILGLSAMIRPLKIQIKLIRIDAPIMIVSALMFWLFFKNLYLGRLEGAVFFLMIVLYTVANFYMARRATKKEVKDIQAEIEELHLFKNLFLNIFVVLASFAVLIWGSNILVIGAVRLARILGMSEAMIGLTIIAAGTSMPELATSAVAAFRKESDIAVGNIVGSNIFNILGIMGVASIMSPIQGAGILPADIYVMIGITLILVPMMRTHSEIKRVEGILLMLIFLAYMFFRIRFMNTIPG
jgi:cation:H+ antiporter